MVNMLNRYDVKKWRKYDGAYIKASLLVCRSLIQMCEIHWRLIRNLTNLYRIIT